MQADATKVIAHYQKLLNDAQYELAIAQALIMQYQEAEEAASAVAVPVQYSGESDYSQPASPDNPFPLDVPPVLSEDAEVLVVPTES